MSGFFATVRFKKTHPEARTPTRAHESDAGNDLYAVEEITIAPGEVAKIKTGVALVLPEHCYGQIADRSSMAAKGLHVTGGVIDCSYTGEISVILANLNSPFWAREPISIKKGDKIAQLIIKPIYEVTFEEIDVLPNTVRGSKGFGSSGS